jgi:spermidine synthase
MVCHGELAGSRPAAAYLTRFYLLVSAGGALGGVFVTVVAPLVFPAFWELPLAMGLTCLLRLMGPRLVAKQPNGPARGSSWAAAAVRTPGIRTRLAAAAFAMVVVGLLGPPAWAEFLRRGAVLQFSRNFYGVLRVSDKDLEVPELRSRELVHGNTVHGRQFLAEDRRRVATSYYGPASGVAVALRLLASRNEELTVGVVGLGAGTLAAYAEAGMTFRFYEIDPEVVAIAEEKFSFLADARSRNARVTIRTGDGRRLLADDLTRGAADEVDLLVLDAFSSDAIPVHLLTAEALEIYLGHLRPEGVLAIHISNRYLDLSPVVGALARTRSLTWTQIDDAGDDAAGTTRSEWMLLSRAPDLIDSLAIEAALDGAHDADPAPVLWTDDYSSLLPLLR